MLCRQFTMSSTKSTVTRIASSRTRPEQFPRTVARPLSAGELLSPAFMNTANSGMLERFNERYRSDGVDTSIEESSELGVFYEFLAHHVQLRRTADVQCMRLWSEWVRFFQRRTSGFPEQVLEQEFRSAITDIFGVAIAEDGFQGTIYSGLRFVP